MGYGSETGGLMFISHGYEITMHRILKKFALNINLVFLYNEYRRYQVAPGPLL